MSMHPLMLGGGAAHAYQIANSLRFDSARSTYLSRLFGTPTNPFIWTVVARVKRSALSTLQAIFTGGSPRLMLHFHSDDTIRLDYSGTGFISTSGPVYRDTTNHYDILLAFDATQAVLSNRVKLYVNGVQQTLVNTSFSPSQNTAYSINTAVSHMLGYSVNDSNYLLNGYLSDTYFIDGQALTPSSFGQISGASWAPKKYAGTYGNNGCHLTFSDNTSLSTLGADSSGNGNAWTLNNCTLSGINAAQTADTPTNNYCTLDYLTGSSGVNPFAITNGALRANAGGGSSGPNYYNYVYGAWPLSIGLWYWEVTVAANDIVVGVVRNNDKARSGSSVFGSLSTDYSYSDDGKKRNSGSYTAYGAAFGVGDVIGIALNLSAGTIAFYKNGVSQGQAFFGLTGVFWPALANDGGLAASANINFGQFPFSYAPPSGYVTLCSVNLSSTTITTSGTFTGNAAADGPVVYLNGTPTVMTINGNAVTWGAHADKLASGFKVRTAAAGYNASGSNSYTVTTTGATFKTANAQVNP